MCLILFYPWAFARVFPSTMNSLSSFLPTDGIPPKVQGCDKMQLPLILFPSQLGGLLPSNRCLGASTSPEIAAIKHFF